MFGARRAAVADRAVGLVERLAVAVRAVGGAVIARRRWRLTDLYVAVVAARWAAEHRLLEQAAAALDDGDDVEVVAVRTWPWFGARYVYEENQ